MGRKIGSYINKKNTNSFAAVDFHDFIDMVQSGLADEEIAKELGINKYYIEKLKNEMKKDF